MATASGNGLGAVGIWVGTRTGAWPVAATQGIGQRPPIEFTQERLHRRAEQRRQAAADTQHALPAIGRLQIGLGQPDDVAQPDIGRLACQGETAAPSARGFEQSAARELVDHLHHMILRNTVRPRDIGDGQPDVAISRRLQQDAQGVIGMQRQPNRNSPCPIDALYLHVCAADYRCV
jgi:hypothetical protein